MKVKFLKDSSVFFITSIITSGLGFITLPIYTRHLSAGDYGILTLFFLFGSIIVNLGSLGLMNASYRYYFEYKNEQRSFQIFNTTNVIFNLITFIFIGSIIYYSASWISNNILANRISPRLLQLSYLSGCLNYFIQFFLHLLAAQLKTIPFAIISIIKIIFDILLSFYFIFLFSLTYMARINATLISQGIIFVISFIAIKNLFTFKFSFNSLKKSLLFSYPTTPTTIINLAYQSFDKTMIINYRDIASLGYYNIGEKFAGIFKITTDSITRVFNPFFQEKAHEDSLESKKDIMNLFYDLSSIYLVGAFAVICFSEELIKLLTTEEFYPSIYLAPLFVFYYLFGAVFPMLALNQIMYGKKLIFQIPVSMTSIIINISLNIFLIPKYGAIGAVITTAFTALISDSLLLYFGQKAFQLPINFRKLITGFILIILFTLPIYYLMYSDMQILQKIFFKIFIFLSFWFSLYKLSLFNKDLISLVINILKKTALS